MEQDDEHVRDAFQVDLCKCRRLYFSLFLTLINSCKFQPTPQKKIWRIIIINLKPLTQ